MTVLAPELVIDFARIPCRVRDTRGFPFAARDSGQKETGHSPLRQILHPDKGASSSSRTVAIGRAGPNRQIERLGAKVEMNGDVGPGLSAKAHVHDNIRRYAGVPGRGHDDGQILVGDMALPQPDDLGLRNAKVHAQIDVKVSRETGGGDEKAKQRGSHSPRMAGALPSRYRVSTLNVRVLFLYRWRAYCQGAITRRARRLELTSQ